MSEYEGESRESGDSNAKEHDLWMRLLYIAVFGVAFYLNTMLLCVLVIAQVFFSVFTGSTNAQLLHMGGVMTEYMHQLMKFLTFRSDDLPFPFSPLPDSE